jgi:hypothetical protein
MRTLPNINLQKVAKEVALPQVAAANLSSPLSPIQVHTPQFVSMATIRFLCPI